MTRYANNVSRDVSFSPTAGQRLRGCLTIVENLYVVLLCGFLIARIVLRSVWWVTLLNNFVPLYFLPLIILLPLAIVTGQLYVSIRLLTVGMIGGVWFAPYFFPKAVEAAPSGVVRVATLNADIANPNVDLVRDWLRSTPLDAVFIQETPDSWRDDDVSGQLADIYPYNVATAHNLDEDGKVFLSRFPIVDSSEFKLTEVDRFFQQRFVVETSIGQIVMYNIHLMPNLGDTPRYIVRPYNPFVNIALSYDENLRQIQIDTLLSQLAHERLPYIVAGDFNTSNFSFLYNDLAGTMQDSFHEAGIGFGMSWPATGIMRFVPFLRIDYIWNSPGLRAVSSQVGSAGWF